MQSWNQIRRRRREQRASLIAWRQAIPQDERRRLQRRVLGPVERDLPELAKRISGSTCRSGAKSALTHWSGG